jgi:hypothetical protein
MKKNKKKQCRTGLVTDKTDAGRHFFGLAPDGKNECRDVDASVNILFAQLCPDA